MLTPNFRGYYNSEFINYQKGIITISKKFNLNTLKLIQQVTGLEADTTNLVAVYGLDQGSDITDVIIDRDVYRDDALIGIRTNIESYTYHHDEAKRAAAKLLLAAIDKHGKKIYKFNYIAETETITKIISDITTDATLQAAVTTLGLAEWFAELDTANKLFSEAFLNRNTEKSDKPTTTTLAQRINTIAAYNTLLTHINANNVLTPSEDYAKLLKEIDTLTEEYNLVVKKRQANKKEVPPTTPK